MSKGKATRQAFGEHLVRLGEKHSQVVVLDADLAKSTKSELFAKKFPGRFFEMGIAEANMIGTAAGMSFAGKLPFLCSFGCFITGRYDTIRISAVYAQANIRLVGTHAGLGIGEDGYSQMGLEDVALMRSLPTMGVFQPMDAAETEAIMEFLVEKWKGPAYLRLTRQNLPDYYPKGKPYQPDELLCVRPSTRAAGTSSEIVLIGSGAGVAECIKAAETMEVQGSSVTVWNASCLKPFNGKSLLSAVRGAKLVVTVEDHSIIGGLGSCVSEVLAQHPSHPRLIRLGVQDTFGESGLPEELYEKYGISGAAIAQRISHERLAN